MRLRRHSCFALPLALTLTAAAAPPDRVKIASGTIEGTGRQASGVREFKGIPYAAPPLGNCRWAPPERVSEWSDIRQANQFGPRCMQQSVFGDMGFRSNGMSEDCLYLNVWTPARNRRDEKLPVMVYFSAAVSSRAMAPSRGMTAKAWRPKASSP